MRRYCLLLLLLLALAAPAPATADATPAIAAAASLRTALDEAAIAFRRSTGRSVRLTYGASGSLVQQIRNGAPYQLFLSADEAHVVALAADGRTLGGPADRGRNFAVGRLVLFAPPRSPLQVDSELQGLRRGLADGSVRRLAIANPDVAPYGARAREALQHADLWDAAKPRLVYGENISQTLQFATSGGADGGLVSLSLVRTPGVAGRYALIPADRHAPLTQRMVLLPGAGTTARRFHDWLLGPAGQRILSRHGYTRP